ncbi:MAG: LD-carboxypeptidase [Verrucomicrobiae bacterium]|nr:LD-carboxypeptidase [Verrucomicrobiae bacterium]
MPDHSLLHFPPTRTVAEGSTLAIVAPSGPFDRTRFEAGLDWLSKRYRIRIEDGIFDRQGYFAGSDDRRLRELRAAISDPTVDAILCARGGYGAARLLPGLDLAEIAAANKCLVGFSDITALHALWARAGVRSVHAPMVAALGGASETICDEWIRTLEGRDDPESWEIDPVVPGEITGRLFGGNLAVLASLVGTPYGPPLDDCLLFLEDVGERPYRVDRMLTTLRQAGWLERCAGFVIGEFTEGDPGADGVTIRDVILDRLGDLGVPVAMGFPAGHVDHNEPLTFGAQAKLSGNRFTIDLA